MDLFENNYPTDCTFVKLAEVIAANKLTKKEISRKGNITEREIINITKLHKFHTKNICENIIKGMNESDKIEDKIELTDIYFEKEIVESEKLKESFQHFIESESPDSYERLLEDLSNCCLSNEVFTRFNLAEYFHKNNDFLEAMQHYEKILNTLIEIKSYYKLNTIVFNLSNYYYQLNLLEKALVLLNKITPCLDKLKNKSLIKKQLATFFIKREHYELAYDLLINEPCTTKIISSVALGKQNEAEELCTELDKNLDSYDLLFHEVELYLLTEQIKELNKIYPDLNSFFKNPERDYQQNYLSKLATYSEVSVKLGKKRNVMKCAEIVIEIDLKEYFILERSICLINMIKLAELKDKDQVKNIAKYIVKNKHLFDLKELCFEITDYFIRVNCFEEYTDIYLTI